MQKEEGSRILKNQHMAKEAVDWAQMGPGGSVLTVKIRQPSHEFTFGVGISFIPYPLVLTPVV
jgi:hypothetical protein